MFSVLVLLEDSKNVWSDHLPQKIGNPPAKNRFFHFRHAVPAPALAPAAHLEAYRVLIERLVWSEAI